MTSSVSGKRSPAELIAPGNPKIGGGDGNRTRVHGFAGRCLTTRPLHRWGPCHLHLRADDGIRTRDPHLGKVMRYQLRYIRAPRTRSSPGAKHDDSPRERAHTNFSVQAVSRLARRPGTRCGRYRHGWRVLIFDVVRRLGAGPVAQWESVRFTRGRSLVRSQPGPLLLSQLAYGFWPCDTSLVLSRCYPVRGWPPQETFRNPRKAPGDGRQNRPGGMAQLVGVGHAEYYRRRILR